MTASEYLEGVVFLAVMLGGTGRAAALVGGRDRGAPAAIRASRFGVLWLAGIFAVHVVPGAVGLLDRWAVALATLVLLGAALLATRRSGQPRTGVAHPAAEPSGARSWLFASVAAGATGLVLVALALLDAEEAPFHVDVASFHLPNVARWIQTETLWQIDDFIPDRSPGNYPQTGDVYSLAAMLPWDSDFLVRFVNYPLVALAAVSTYALGRELRAPAATAVVTAAAFIASPVVAWGAYAGLTDVAMLATFAAGCLFLLRHARTGSGLDLVVAGTALGLSFGSRWYAVPAVAAVVIVWAGARLIATPDRRATLRALAAVTGLIALWGGFWLLRNWVLSGNPVFPVKVAPLGLTIFDAPRDVFRELEGFTIAGYADRPAIWREYFFPGFLRAMGLSAVVLWLGLAGAGGYVLARAARGGLGGPCRRALVTAGALVLAAAVIGVVYTITPYTATGPPDRPAFAWVNSRYVVPALLIGAAAAAWLIAQTGRWRQAFELVMALAALDGVRRVINLPGPDLGAGELGFVAVLLALLAAAAGAAYRLRGARRFRMGMAVAALLASLWVVAVGRDHQQAYERERYAGVSDPLTYVSQRVPTGQRIGFVGEGWGNYPFFGPRLGNEVEFVGRRVRGTYRNYRSGPALLRALDRGRYGLVVFHDFASIDRGLPARQERWLRAGGYREVVSGPNPLGFNQRVTIYRRPS